MISEVYIPHQRAGTAGRPYKVTATPALTMRSTFLAILSTGIGTGLAILLIPESPADEGALFYPALIMSAGLATAPVAAALRYPKALLRGESLVALAPIYWLLLDLLQGVYGLEDITADQVRLAFLGIGLFVVMVWLGAIRRSWKIPKVLISSVAAGVFHQHVFRPGARVLFPRHVEICRAVQLQRF